MQKNKVLGLLRANGDSTIIFNSRFEEPVVVTTDFSTPYIRARNRGKRFVPKQNGILVWDWTNDSFKIYSATNIKRIIPLSDTLGNIKDGEETESW